MRVHTTGLFAASLFATLVLLETSASAYLGVARYTRFGQLDPEFNQGAPLRGEPLTSGYSAAVMSGDKTIAVGFFEDGTPSDGNYGRLLVGRYLKDGTGDPTFGWLGGTTVTCILGSPYEEGVAVVLQGSSVIVLGSSTAVGGDHSVDMLFLARFNNSGTFDTTFGVWGGFLPAFGVKARALARSADGSLVILGQGGSEVWVHKVNSNANTALWTRSPSFQNGVAGSIARDVTTDSVNRVIVVGRSPSQQVGVVRLTKATGALDSNFANGGRLLMGSASPAKEGTGVAIDSSGRILVVGRNTSWAHSDAYLYRVTSVGTTTSASVYSFGGGASTVPWSIATIGNNFYVAGSAVVGGTSHFALVKFLGVTFSQDNAFGSGGQILTPFNGFTSALGAGLTVESATEKPVVVGLVL